MCLIITMHLLLVFVILVLEIRISHGSTPPYITVQPEEYVVYKPGKLFQLKCEAEAIPLPR